MYTILNAETQKVDKSARVAGKVFYACFINHKFSEMIKKLENFHLPAMNATLNDKASTTELN